jgi:chemotaxis protein CheZ
MANSAGLESGDSAELEALFDSIATVPAKEEPPAVAAVRTATPASESGDSDELESLFDSVAAEVASSSESLAATANEPPVSVEGAASSQDKMFNSIGQMARQLHDTLRQLGYDKMIEDTVNALPDAKDRLSYIANLTEQAACRVLNATDIAQPIQDGLLQDSKALSERWDRLYSNQLSVAEFKVLAGDTRDFLKVTVPAKVDGTNAQLMEIMMAQDFQDLTGQVIKKVITLAQGLETQLMAVLIDALPGERRNEEMNSLLNGPVINAEGRADVVVSQEQVDDLLDSLGF